MWFDQEDQANYADEPYDVLRLVGYVIALVACAAVVVVVSRVPL